MSQAAPAPGPAIAAASKVASTEIDKIGLATFVLHPGVDRAPIAHRITLATEPADEVKLAARDYLSQVTQQTMLPYGPATVPPSGHSLYLAQDRAVNLAATEGAMATGNVDVYDPKAPYATKINLLAFRLTLNDKTNLTLYRVLKAQLRFGGGRRRLLPLHLQDGQYSRLDPADVLLFDLDFDFVVTEQTAIFDLKATFERVFGFFEELRANSVKTFNRVTKDLRIKGIKELRAACTTEVTMMNKMSSIARSLEEPDYAAAMTMDKLVAFVHANPALGVEVVGKGAKAELVFDNSPQKRFKLLNLLDDDFLHSALTDREYEAASKVRAGATSA